MKEKKAVIRNGKKRYRPWIAFALFWVRLFTKKRKVEGELPKGACVFLCRHRDEDGVIGSFTSLKTVLRPWVLNTFVDYDTCKKHLKEYTLREKWGKGSFMSNLIAPVMSFGLTSLIRSARAIPVYRGEEARKSIVTIKSSVRALEEGDQLLVFPDVDYASDDAQSGGEIYKGFVSVDKLYFRRNGEHIKFVPVYMTKKRVVIHEPVFFGEEPEEETIAKIVEKIYNE